jgi:hypothetical protein
MKSKSANTLLHSILLFNLIMEAYGNVERLHSSDMPPLKSLRHPFSAHSNNLPDPLQSRFVTFIDLS